MNLDYTGKTFLNCKNAGQTSALAADSAFGSEVRSNYAADLGEATGIFNSVNNSLNGIVAAGESQQGFSPAELAAKNSQAIENAAASNKNIIAAIGEKGAMGGAAPGVQSGATEGAIANAEAKTEANLSNTEAGITEQNYATGRENFQNAVAGEEKLPSATMEPVNQAAGEANSANTAADTEANAVAASSNSWMGLVGGLAGSAVTGLTGTKTFKNL